MRDAMLFQLDEPYNVACNINRGNWIVVLYKVEILINIGWSVGRKLTGIILCCWCFVYLWSWTFRCEYHQTSTDWYRFWYFCFGLLYIYFSILYSVFILTQCALIYWCLITFLTLSAQDSILNKHLIMIMLISIFTVNLSYNDILFCLFKISFVCWQWFLNRHYLKFK